MKYLTVFGPVFACFLASPEKLGWWRTQEGSHGGEMVSVVELRGLGVVDIEEHTRLEQVPCLACVNSEGLLTRAEWGLRDVPTTLWPTSPQDFPIPCQELFRGLGMAGAWHGQYARCRCVPGQSRRW